MLIVVKIAINDVLLRLIFNNWMLLPMIYIVVKCIMPNPLLIVSLWIYPHQQSINKKLPNKMKMCFLSISLFMKGANIISSRYDCTNQYEQWVMKKSDFTMRKIEKLYPQNIHCKP